MSSHEVQLRALLICPNRGLADAFLQTLPTSGVFQVLADLRIYPTEQTLDLRLRQMAPRVVLVDIMTDIDFACRVLQFVASIRPPVHSVGLHFDQHGESIVRVLRAGATELLFAPFDSQSQREAGDRIARLSQPEESASDHAANCCAFACTKSGSGASTIAAQVAFAIRRQTGKRVLLADFDLSGGTIGFYFKVQTPFSLLDALEFPNQLDPASLGTMTTTVEGVDILASPEEPHLSPLDPTRLEVVLDVMRSAYDFVILDLPTVFDRSSLLVLAQADSGFLVTTAELPSLHLTRKALQMMQQLGFDERRLRVIVNRLNRQDGLSSDDLGKMFNSAVHTTLPNDYFSLHRVVTRGEPLSGEGVLVRALEALARKIASSSPPEAKKNPGLAGVDPNLSQT
jgi:pilus assembly protein CpaE